MSASPIVHIEIAAKDPVVADKFYSEVFGWKIEVDQRFNYHQFEAQGGPAGAFVEVDATYKAGDIVPYLGVDDIDAMLKKVEKAGGKVLLPKTEIPGVGWYAFLGDPTGNRIGLYARMPPQG
jgi:predicted enzyme related to lactoylglutathione lyase